ncbi:hypothetical protein J3R82DRAFT_10332 [Butyriboletus roseoflavus]|nr:hypothetical protein J3R82DRAFT_10332 [Butyriboletus roseoflavus]
MQPWNRRTKVNALKAEVAPLKEENVELKQENGTLEEEGGDFEGQGLDTLHKSQLRELRLSNETNQAHLLDVSSPADQDLVLADLEGADGRVAAVEEWNEVLRVEIETLRAESENEDLITSLQSCLSTLESTNADLTAQLLSTQAQLSVKQNQLVRHDEEEGAKRDDREESRATSRSGHA